MTVPNANCTTVSGSKADGIDLEPELERTRSTVDRRQVRRLDHDGASRRREARFAVFRLCVLAARLLLHAENRPGAIAPRRWLRRAQELRVRGDRFRAVRDGSALRRAVSTQQYATARPANHRILHRDSRALLSARNGRRGHRIRVLRLGGRVRRDDHRAVLGTRRAQLRRRERPATISADHGRRGVGRARGSAAERRAVLGTRTVEPHGPCDRPARRDVASACRHVPRDGRRLAAATATKWARRGAVTCSAGSRSCFATATCYCSRFWRCCSTA